VHDQDERLGETSLGVTSDPILPLKGRRILVMDDEPILALDLQCIVEEAGGLVVGPATSVSGALKLLETNRLDCALLDVRMGKEMGFTVAERLSATGIPWLFHTGNADHPQIHKEWPRSAVLTKPSLASDLVKALASLLV
jgi:CheY-like chemotaxis protein